MCIGSRLRADDAAGMLVYERLWRFVQSRGFSKRVLVIAADTAPENFTGQIRRFRPSCLVMVDAADTGKVPGEISVLGHEEIAGLSFCTHKLPLKILADYLVNSTGCQVVAIGIKPGKIKFAHRVSARVNKAAGKVAAAIKELLTQIMS